jgi:hypothetical protein
MPRDEEVNLEQSESQPVAGYDPPRIEVVLTAEDLGREGMYAAIGTPPISTS